MKRHSRTDAPDFWDLARDYLHNYLPVVRSAPIHRRVSGVGGSRHANAPAGRQDWTC